MTIRVLVADDHAAVRPRVVMILSGAGDIEVVGDGVCGVLVLTTFDLGPRVGNVMRPVRRADDPGVAGRSEKTVPTRVTVSARR